ncbi:MAG TPA: hypothetical protein VFU31_30510 [Candidatus Binatia bacterium]|nr:hypothetical protein [Candidatus Binatia bacterium]
MNSPTARFLGLTAEQVRAILAKNGVKVPEPLTEKGVDQLYRMKAAERTKEAMRKARQKK